ncbi:putative transcriptional regulator [Palleronia marisminoris]|uniref:UPF0301 protein PAM7066_01904 n=2 Tax=Palleronia marisminoris TaxID=315423 RepID=A0A1Y5SLJ8_9RHOB|nr:putative transcriptional regulator [Palleronia marisminoris]SLN43414.1 hypothetical protein PAM7066_01904 [Palleronia marisminoris]
MFRDMTDVTELTGKLLIAMPGMGDPRFEKSVVVVVAHGADGGMGLIVNKPAPSIGLGHLFEQLSIEGQSGGDKLVYFGGPVENSRGFVLHDADYRQDDTTLSIDPQFGMTATLDILRAMAEGGGPEKSLVALGYAGWGPGQLEEEIAENGWLIADANPDLVFSDDHSGKWIAAIETLGIDPIMLSAEGGRA